MRLGQGDAAGLVYDNVQQSKDQAPAWQSLPKNSIPTKSAIGAMYAPNTVGGQPDIVVDWIYDSQALTTGATNSNVTFFQTTTVARALRNITTGNGLPSQEAFWMTGIRFELFNDQNAANDYGDYYQTLRQGYYDFYIGNKPYLSGYLLNFLNCQAPLVVNTRYFTIQPARTLLLPLPLAIPPQTTFNATVTLVAPTFNSSASWWLRCVLQGYRYRAVQ